jgi:FRG domain
MDQAAFTRQLSAWLDPWRLAWLARQYAEDPAALERSASATREASNFRRAGDVGLDRLIRDFLETFQLSGEFLSLLPKVTRVPLSDGALARLSRLRFTGSVTFGGFEASSPAGTVAAFMGPAIEIHAVAGPLSFLVRWVDQIAGVWMQLPRGMAFYEPSLHTELGTYVEGSVARALGFTVDAAWTSGRPGQNLRPAVGVVTMVGTPPFDRRLVAEGWAMIRRAPVPAPRVVAEEAAPSVFEDKDGLILLSAKEAADPWHNLEHFRNECSPLSGVEAPAPRGDGKLLVDSHYGRAFDFVVSEQSAVYGFTDDLEALRQPGDLGCLRVPYRSVPRIRVRSRAEVEGIVDSVRAQSSSLVDSHLLLRGQAQEYLLGRSAAAMAALYGDPAALEPSLLASAVRKRQPLEEVLPEWCFLIRCYQMGLQIQLMNQSDPAQADQLSSVMQADRQRLELSLDNHSLALSLAQHYGLPSMGLDLTDRVDTALFFALHRFPRAEGRKLQAVPVSAGADAPVLYVFLLPQRFCVDYSLARPKIFPRGRPDAQVAWFSHMGWGYRRNQCAEYLVAALYLDPRGDFGPLPRAEDLFPPIEEDLFGSLIEGVLATDWASPILRTYLEQLYWLAR